MRRPLPLVAFAIVPLSLLLAACAAADDDAIGASEDDVRVDTSTPLARAQYDANVAFALGYTPRCKVVDARYPTVVVTGYGRFMHIASNATGQTVARAVPGLTYPRTDPPAAGAVDPPAAQVAVASALVTLPSGAKANVCGMVLPVSWDLAAVLVAKEVDAIGPALVVMNGVAGAVQPLWLELGAMNRAGADLDGSGNVAPKTGSAGGASLIPGAPFARPNLLDFRGVRRAVEEELARQPALVGLADGVRFAGYPRASNDYLCNNVTYTVGYLMDTPGKPVKLLQASKAIAGRPNAVPLTMRRDLRAVPRVFVHWPSAIVGGAAEGKQLDGAAAVLLRLVDSALAARTQTSGAELPADPGLEGGKTF